MMTHRFVTCAAVAVAILALMGCKTTQTSGNTSAPAAAPAAASTTESTAADTQKVKGINDWEGEISGKPAPGSKFMKLKIGMSMKQVTDLIGPPTDQGQYVTGKAWIPFYYGSDRYRHELIYKGQGRLVFAGGGMGDYSAGNLVMIIHNAKESGYR